MRPPDRSRVPTNDQFIPDPNHSLSNHLAVNGNSSQSRSQIRPSEKSQTPNQIFSHTMHSQSNYSAQRGSSSRSTSEMRPSRRSNSTPRSEHADSSTVYDGISKSRYLQRSSSLEKFEMALQDFSYNYLQ